jgi:hypothetical protein
VRSSWWLCGHPYHHGGGCDGHVVVVVVMW